jgi:hypothetical protein
VINVTLKRNNAKAKSGRWAPGETEDEVGWEAIAEDLEEERKDTLEFLRETSISKLQGQLSRLDLAFQRLRALADETSRNYGPVVVNELPVLNLLTLDRLRGLF